MTKKKLKRSTLIAIFAVFLCAGLGTAGYFIYQNITLQSELEGFQTTTTTDYDFYSFAINATLTGEEMLNVTCTPYYVSTIGLDDSDIAALIYSDFTAGTAKHKVDATDKFDIDDYEDKLVIFKLTEYTCQDHWVSPDPGVNNETMMNKTTDLNLIAFERDGGGFTVNQTTDPKWSVTVKAFNGTSATGKATPRGFSAPNFDFANDAWNYTIIRLETNVTTNLHAFFDMPDAVDEVISGNYTYFYFSDDWTSVNFSEYDLNIASALNTTFKFIEIAAGYGNLDSTVTIYDTQN